MAHDRPEIQDFILSRELAEVYLLLDHISTAGGKQLPKELDKEPVFDSSPADHKPWLEQVCDIAWPPKNTTRQQDARNAAKLVVAKDALNRAAAPATGTSIAFTLMMAGEAREREKEANWWRRARFGRSGDGDGDGGDGDGGDGDGTSLAVPSRASLAALAYQGLARGAWFYRGLLYLLLCFLIVWAAVTCAVSWDVATGTALLNRVTSLDDRLAIAQRDGASKVPPPSTGASPVPTPTPTPPAAGTDPGSIEQVRLLRVSALKNLENWLSDRGDLREMIRWLMGASGEDPVTIEQPSAMPATTSAPVSGTAVPPAEPKPVLTPNLQWAAAFLGVLATTVLPIFYGLLGAGAAVVRGVSAKMRDSVLSPRDIILAYVQLALGAVMGLCIGLFVNPDGTATSPSGLIGSLHLSASALCFVAGFGVERVFRALESLIGRVFDPDPPAPPSSR